MSTTGSATALGEDAWSDTCPSAGWMRGFPERCKIFLYADGGSGRIGRDESAVATGGLPSGPTPTVATVSMTLGTETFATQFAGWVAAATYKITFTVPKDANPCANQLTINVGNISSFPFTMSIASTVPAICVAQNSATYDHRLDARRRSEFVHQRIRGGAHRGRIDWQSFPGHHLPGHRSRFQRRTHAAL